MTFPGKRLSIQTKLFVSIVVVIVLSSVIAYLFINYSVREAFSTFTVRSFTMQDRVLLQVIVAYYNRTGSFDGLVDFLEQSDVRIPLLLVDPGGEVVFPGEEEQPDHRLSEEDLERGQAIVLPSGETWTLVPYRVNPERAELESVFLRRIRRSLWLAGLVAGAAGLLISFLLLRQVTRPLKRLDAATRRIAEGNLRERVQVASSDEIGHLARSFNEMAGSLEDSERAKKRMIADIAHELRTPITAVRSALEGLRDGLIEPSEETFTALHNRILLLTRLVGDLHQLALADAGRLSIQRSPSSLTSIVEGIVEAIGAQAEDAGLRLHSSIEPSLPTLDVDAHRIEQVLLNLLANAIRHTPEGGEIRISADRLEGEVRVSICDTGPGLAPTDLPRVFDRFYRADTARTRPGDVASSDEEARAGLGLPIAKALVEAHGGRIWAENAEIGGACFRFTIPVAK
ncbi:MAG: ATP-binding protein [Candidatus Bipolaricaulia bacterium]